MLDQITSALKRPLTAAGFRKRNRTWYLDCPELILVVHIERHGYGKHYELVTGIWFSKIEHNETPLYYKCQVYGKVVRLFPQQRDLLTTACALDKTTPELLAELEQFVDQSLVPYLKAFQVEGDVKRELEAKGPLAQLVVLGTIEYYLGLAPL